MRTDKMQPLPWTHHVSKYGNISAVLDAEGVVVCGSLICGTADRKEYTKRKQTHAYIVKQANAGACNG